MEFFERRTNRLIIAMTGVVGFRALDNSKGEVRLEHGSPTHGMLKARRAFRVAHFDFHEAVQPRLNFAFSVFRFCVYMELKHGSARSMTPTP